MAPSKQDGAGRRTYTGFNARWRDASVIASTNPAIEPPLPFTEAGEPVVAAPAERQVPEVRLLHGDVLEQLALLPAGRISTVITSPPFYGLRVYGIPPRTWDDGISCVLGEEPSLEEYITHLVEVFREIKRVLHPRGSLFLNLGDCYAGGGKHVERKAIYDIPLDAKPTRPRQRKLTGKDLLMVPARAALALQADGWILRNDIIWAKALSFCPGFSGSVMPESTRDRATWAHEHVFQLTLSERYFYDQDGCREPFAESTRAQMAKPYTGQATKDYVGAGSQNPSDVKRRVLAGLNARGGRNLRNVWVVPKENFTGWVHDADGKEISHFATFPTKLVEPLVRLGSSEKGVCRACASPWVRHTQREVVPESVQEAFEAARAASAAATGRTDGHTAHRPNHRRAITGESWMASCACHAGDPIPATVCDPFSGSGRTGVVARRLGRSYVGIDASAEYIRMAERAILATPPPDGGHPAAGHPAEASVRPGPAESR